MPSIHFFKIAILISALFSTILALNVALKKKKTPPLHYFSGLMFSIAFYGMNYLLELSVPTLKSAVIFLYLEYTGLTFIPFFWFSLSWFYQAKDSTKASRALRFRPLFFLIPLLMILFVWTNSFHHLLYKSYYLQPNVPLTILRAELGTLFYPYNIFLSVVAFMGTLKIIINMFTTKGRFRGQFALMTIAALLPTVGHILNLTIRFPYHMDLGPIFFALAGLFTWWGMISIQLFDLTPIAKNLVLNALEDGVIVLDLRNRLVEYNKAAITNYFENKEHYPGKKLDQLNKSLSDKLSSIQNNSEFVYPNKKGDVTIVKVTRTDIKHRLYGTMGSLFILRDITELRSYVKKLENLASIDTLTGLPNRRHFINVAAEELKQSEENNDTFSLIILDIDHFKSVNDTYGHSAGDEGLRTISRLIKENMRSDSIYGRYGGEEFVIILPHTSMEQARVVMDRLRLVIEQSSFEFEGNTINITASFGISSFQANLDMTLENCFKQADRAMYKAKSDGRNRICLSLE
jgi:diguanylate cyclase (GGDEF)-like protein